LHAVPGLYCTLEQNQIAENPDVPSAMTGMRRIVIVGCAGSGKSTLAKRLGELLGIPVVHLDALNWEPGWKTLTTEEFRARLKDAISGDAWITDGNYAVLSFDLRMPRADLVIWVQRPLTQCIWRVFRRAFKSYCSADEDLAPQCKERFDRRFLDRLRYIVHFNRVNRPRIEKLRVSHGPDVPVIVLRSDREISGFLASVGREKG
jgi:adenylate kinase family enzyme